MDLVMKVGASGIASIPQMGDNLSPLHLLPGGDQVTGIVGKEGATPVSVIEDKHIAPTPHEPRE